MYYSTTHHHNNQSFICHIEHKSLSEVDGLDCSQVVAQKGFATFDHSVDFEQLKQWSLDVGYFVSDIMPDRDYSVYDSALTFYPDNEEMLIIYNSSNDDVNISVSNTAQLPKDIVHWQRWNLYDDVWGTVNNDNFSNSFVKDVTSAQNFDSKNKSKYNPVRKNNIHKLKVFPRHPMWTECMFAPKHMNELSIMTKDQIENNAEALPGFTGHPLDTRYCMDFAIKPKCFVILDQIITQWKSNSDSIKQLKFVPLWYKTKIRKHFNYSI